VFMAVFSPLSVGLFWNLIDWFFPAISAVTQIPTLTTGGHR
jgi:hypothetical protein